MGITGKQSSRWQRAAMVPEEIATSAGMGMGEMGDF
jgi:hypothetical protein